MAKITAPPQLHISHTYSEYLEIEGDDTYHKATCVICGSVNDKLEHGEPNAENKCPDCGHQFKAKEKVYKKITATKDLVVGGSYLIVYEKDSSTGYVFNGGTDIKNYYQAVISGGEIKYDDTISKYEVKITGSTDKYLIQVVSLKQYFNYTKSSNGFTLGATGDNNKISFGTNGNVVITNSGNITFQFNKSSDQLRFRYFAKSQQPVYLYLLFE